MNDYADEKILVLDRPDGSDYEAHCGTSIHRVFVPDGDREGFFGSMAWAAIRPMLHLYNGKVHFYDGGQDVSSH